MLPLPPQAYVILKLYLELVYVRAFISTCRCCETAAAATAVPPPAICLVTAAAYEILELYLELVSVRATMIAQSKTIPGDMMEVGSSRRGGG